jgi:succinate dehydrogenase / fumarate reductase membrane anchor subunit
MVTRTVVGAHYGLRDWLIQRISAVVMAVYTLLFVLILVFAPPPHYGAWRDLFSNQIMKLATFIFFVSVFLHAWVGMRDILMDYVKPTGLRLGLHSLVVLALVADTGWAVQILWSV